MSTETETAGKGKAAGNMSVDSLGAMLAKGRKSSQPENKATEDSTSSETTAETTEAPEEVTEQTATAAATEEDSPSENTAEATTEAAPEETEETAEPTEVQTSELHPDLQAAIDEAKKSGPKGLDKVLKRLHRVVDQRDTERVGRLQAEEKLQQVSQENEQLKQNRPADSTPAVDRFSKDPAVAALDKKLANANAIIEWADENPEGGMIGDNEFTAEQVRKLKRTAEADRVSASADRSALVAQIRSEDAKAEKEFTSFAHALMPSLAKKDSPEALLREQIFEAFPALKELPGREMAAMRYILGMQKEQELIKEFQAKQKLGKPMVKPPGGNQPPKVATRPVAGAPKVDAKQAQADAANSQFKKSGSVNDLAKRFAETSRARKDAARV